MPGSVVMIEVGGRGGVSDYTQQLVTALDARGLHVELVTARDHLYRLPASIQVHPWVPWVREHAPLGRLVRRLGLGSAINALAFLLVLPRIVALGRRVGGVHIQGTQWPPLTALFGLALRLTGTPLTYTAHNTFDRGRSWEWAHRAIFRAAHRIIVHTEADRGRMLARTATEVVVVPHGEYGGLARTGGSVDRAEARAELGIAGDELVALLFGQLRPDKGIGDFLQAAVDAPGVRVLLAGEDIGGLEPARDELATLGDRVTLREGYLPMSEAARFFAAADVVVLPYKAASQSGVLLLAYGFERPVVAYPVGGLVEAIVEGETGWLAEAATPPALAAALREVEAAGRAECARRGLAGRHLADDRYSWSSIADKTAAVYAASGTPR